MDTITIDRYREIFGFPVQNYYIKLGFDFEKESFKKSGLEFIHAYKKRRYEASLYPQVIPLLTKLMSKKINHSILSAQHQSLLDDLTKYYNIRKYFIRINGLDDHYAHSKVKKGIEWINDLGVEAHEVLFIGDTVHDYEVAEAIGVDCLLLSHGHHCYSRLSETGAVVIEKLNDIFHLFSIDLNSVKSVHT